MQKWLYFFTLLLWLTVGRSVVAQTHVAKWSVFEQALRTTGTYTNPYRQAGVKAVFTGPDNQQQTVNGFWDGENKFVIRFAPTAEGTWTYVTQSADKGLHNQRGTLRCTAPAPTQHGFVRRDEQHSYHFVYDDGTRYFMLGNTYYELLGNVAGGGTWQQAVDGTARYGMNKIRFNVSAGSSNAKGSPYPDSSPYGASNDELNLGHWRHLDKAVQYMADRGVVADLILFWNADRVYGTPEQDEAYVRYALARYAAYPNVIWCLVNEWNYTKKPKPYWNRLGQLVWQEDPWVKSADGQYRALSIHHQTRIDFQYFDQPWPTHAIVQYGVRNGQRVQTDEWQKDSGNRPRSRFGDAWGNESITHNLGHRMPVVNDEYGYIGEPDDASEQQATKVPLTREKHRNILWGIYVAGGYASAGDKFAYTDPPGMPYFSADWHDTPAYGDMKRLADFFTTKGLTYWTMTSNNALITQGERVYALADSGRQYVFYAAQGGRFAANLAPGSYRAHQFDPATGKEVRMATVPGGQPYVFSLPAGKDGVIYLQATDSSTRP